MIHTQVRRGKEAIEAPDRPDSELLRTTQPLPFRATPGKDGTRLHTIPEAAVIERLSGSGRWCRVVYLLPDSAVAVVGWVYNRGLVAVDADDLPGDTSGER